MRRSWKQHAHDILSKGTLFKTVISNKRVSSNLKEYVILENLKNKSKRDFGVEVYVVSSRLVGAAKQPC